MSCRYHVNLGTCSASTAELKPACVRKWYFRSPQFMRKSASHKNNISYILYILYIHTKKFRGSLLVCCMNPPAASAKAPITEEKLSSAEMK
jgi:hypothetical protein